MKSYSIDPDLVSLEEFRELTAGRNMLPGRIMLQERMEERFGLLKASGIESLGMLLRFLASKSKIESYAERTGFMTQYLTLLKREAGSYLASPFPLSNFPGFPFEYTELLKSRGIKHTKDLYEQAQTKQQQAQMAADTGIPSYRIEELFSLCDLSRISGVGGVFARTIYEAGIRSVEELAGTAISTQLSRYRKVIEKYNYAAGNLGEEDIRYGIHYARVIVACEKKSSNK